MVSKELNLKTTKNLILNLNLCTNTFFFKKLENLATKFDTKFLNFFENANLHENKMTSDEKCNFLRNFYIFL